MKKLFLHALALILSVTAMLTTPNTARAFGICGWISGAGQCPYDAESLCRQIYGMSCGTVYCPYGSSAFMCCDNNECPIS